ncbi:MAG: ABC transporter substrate-binding protein [Gammaproteobacteria bacterium]|nr:ABC transporter substrate-binding protein [Gammaproteobacteria bacterium]
MKADRLTVRTLGEDLTRRARTACVLLLSMTLLSMSGIPAALALAEAPLLAERVAAGTLPDVARRLPEQPKVLQVPEDAATEATSVERYGGTLRLLMGRAKDVRIMTVYGYARLVVFNRAYELEPDILRSYEVEQGRIFTLHLRRGHRWSDGEPFTSEDFRFYFEDIANNEALSPFGPPQELLIDGEPPVFEVLDTYTVRYTWSRPNPFFLPALAGPAPLYIYAPAHYLKKHHAAYADQEKLDRKAQEKGQRNWAARLNRLNRQYRNTNVNLPVLQPWVNTTPSPSTRFVFERNPYFHRVDQHGNQLPYLDAVAMTIVDSRLIPVKTGAGEADLQARGLSFSDYTFLKASEQRTENELRLWDTTKGAHLALYPNLNVQDPVWRPLLRDVRFRRALSLAINRHEINQVIYYGLAREGNNSVHADCPLYETRYQTAWSQFDVAAANALLDEIGLEKRDARGIRLLPDGRPLEIIVETAGEDTEQTDVLALVADTWRDAGIRLLTKPMQREVFRRRIFSGQTVMSIWGGFENGLPTADMSPQELAPTSQQHLQWPMWGQFQETGGKAGEAVDEPYALELQALNEQWLEASDPVERRQIWKLMLGIHAEQVYTLGLVSAVPQPVVVNRRLMNVPVKGVYNWDPGAHFGIYRPDTFWFRKAEPD